MKPSFYTTLLSALFSLQSFAQFDGSKHQSNAGVQLKNRILLVQYQEFKSDNALNYNTFIESALSKTWTLNDSVIYVNNTEFTVLKMKHPKHNNYAYLKYSTYDKVNEFPSGSLVLGLVDEPNSTYFVHVAPFDETGLNTADLVFGLELLQQKIKRATATTEASKWTDSLISQPQIIDLESKTLLIDQTLTSSVVQKSIPQFYRYDFEFATKTQIDEALLNRDPKFIFIRAIPLTTVPTRYKDYSNEAGVQIIDNNIYFSKTYETEIAKSDISFVNVIMQANDGKLLYIGKPEKGDNQVELSFFETLSNALN
jgi:hypothetical protein